MPKMFAALALHKVFFFTPVLVASHQEETLDTYAQNLLTEIHCETHTYKKTPSTNRIFRDQTQD